MLQRSTYWVLGIAWLVLLAACNQSEPTTTEEAPKVNEQPELEALTQQIEQQPNNPELYFNRGNIYAELGEYPSAIEDFSQAIHLDSSRNYYHVRLSDLYLLSYAPKLNLPDSKRAIDILAAYLEKYPDDQLALHELAETFIYVELYDQSLARLKQAIDAKAYNPDAYFKIGIAYKYKGDTLGAIASFRKAVEQDPELYDAHMQLGLLMSALGNEQALAYYDNAIQIDPESQEALYGKAKFLQDLGRMEAAKRIYRGMVRQNNQNEQALYNLGYVYLAQDSLDKAWRTFDATVQVAPDYAAAYYARGIVNEAKGDISAAIADFRTCLNIDPDYEAAKAALTELAESE